VAAIAVAMSFFGYWAIGKHSGGTLQLIELHDTGWTPCKKNPCHSATKIHSFQFLAWLLLF